MSLGWLRDSYKIICIFLTVLDVVLSVSVRLNISASDLTDQGLPSGINVTINAGINSSTELQLSRVDHINSNVPVYTLDTGDDGVQIERQNLSHNQDFAFYHDVQLDAIFQFIRQNSTERQKDEFIIKRGEFQRGDARYSIQPRARSKRDASSTDDQSEQSYDLQPVVIKPAKHADHVEPPPELRSPLDAEFLKKFQGGAQGNRRRRQSLSTYYIDITAFLDYTAYSRFLAEASYDADVAMQKIQEYFSFIFAGVDLIYQNFESNSFKLRVSLTKIVVFKNDRTLPLVYTRSCSFYTWGCTYTRYVDTERVLTNFSQLLNTSEGRTLAFPYDHSMLFIGSDMWAGSVDILGLAWIKTICSTNGQSVSAIEEMGDYSSIITAAHELGHRTGATCLSNTLPVLNEFPDVSQRLLGQEIPIEKQCELTFGQYSYVCPNTTQSEICSELYCYSLNYGCRLFQAALSGTSCGCGKICKQGQCVETLTSTDKYCNYIDIWKNCTSADCSNTVQKVYCARACRQIFTSTTSTTECADDPYFTYNSLRCPSAMLNPTNLCYEPEVQTGCCRSCFMRLRNVKGCEYGDRDRGKCSNINTCQGNKYDCCHTCSGVKVVTHALAAIVLNLVMALLLT
ncbi:uncharacterized protein LOC106052334 isoform X2 [Biomphalaria glabrata]|uniref:Uncharacterized protein LOC106052334 isoform X2 n=1 Tax=Biomphalaria glabrata TaxID=6526 RepID=A0A9W3BL17_BIOGL|nr:uncharacterized protein LOC106052334 isoform X2 [Biomphalaria glabrata]